jgi:Zn-dependent protease with chaperone function
MLLPEGIRDRLTPAQLEGVVAHELCHVYQRDNLIAAVHISWNQSSGSIRSCGGSESGW